MSVFNPESLVLDLLQHLNRTIGFRRTLQDDDIKDLERLLREKVGGCLAKVQFNEPIFVLRAQDLFAAPTVRDWATRVSQLIDPDRDKVTGALHCASEMELWPGPKKLPGNSKAEKRYSE